MKSSWLLLLGILIIPAAWAATNEAVEVFWLDLMPKENLDIIEAMPEINYDSPFDQNGLQEVMFSASVVDTYEQQNIRIAGYMVPLESNDKGEITEFFLAPYVGACMHTPPPSPNQLIHVKYPKGAEIEGIWFPYEIEGILSLETFDNGMGAAGYTLTADMVKVFSEE